MADSGNSILKDKLVRSAVFWACLLLYAGFRLWQKLFPATVPGMLQNYLADFLCLPIILTLAVLLQRYVVLRNPFYILNKAQVLFTVIYFSVLFELVFPYFFARYTADFWDVLAYAAGGWVYWYFIHPSAVRQTHSAFS